MKKRLAVLALLLVMVVTSLASWADENPVVFRTTVTVSEGCEKVDLGFATIVFPKNFLEKTRLPASFQVEISALDGVAGIEFSPNTADFLKDVRIMVHPYEGLLYDKSSGQNIPVDIGRQILKVEHFSRYAFST